MEISLEILEKFILLWENEYQQNLSKPEALQKLRQILITDELTVRNNSEEVQIFLGGGSIKKTEQ